MFFYCIHFSSAEENYCRSNTTIWMSNLRKEQVILDVETTFYRKNYVLFTYTGLFIRIK